MSVLSANGKCAHGLFYSLQRQMKEMDSLKKDFTKYLATADSSLLQTNNLLQQMDKSQKVAEASGLLDTPKPVKRYCQEAGKGLSYFFLSIFLLHSDSSSVLEKSLGAGESLSLSALPYFSAMIESSLW